MIKNRNKRILFHNPDYHCTFFYQKELQKLGWKADILVVDSYPEKLLYDSKRVLKTYKITSSSSINYILWILSNFYKYKYIFYYSRPPNFSTVFKKLGIKSPRDPLLTLLKLFRRKIIYLPSGCRDEFTKAIFSLVDNGNVCGNCGIFDKCDEDSNIRNLNLIDKYADLIIGNGFTKPTFNKIKHIKWKSFDLDAYNPNIKVPDNYLIPKSNIFKILHSTSLEGRDLNGKNIKGSSHIVAAVERLISEGFNCELIRITDVSSANMKYIQVQSDLIIDQLIYGHCGSTSLEGIALGKPVICYFNKVWKENYIDSFNIQVWPFIEADTNNIYTVLRNLLINPVELERYSEKSLDYAHKYLDIKLNAEEFIQVLGKL